MGKRRRPSVGSMANYDPEYDTPLMVSDEPDDDGQYLLFFLRSGATVKCGYVFADAVENVRAAMPIRWTEPDVATYGQCEVCHAPRTMWEVTDDSGILSGLCCATHPEHGPDTPPDDR